MDDSPTLVLFDAGYGEVILMDEKACIKSC